MSAMLDIPLPEWAERASDGEYTEVGAQLATRDGRRLGNAYVDAVDIVGELGYLVTVITDMGNVCHMTLRELQEAFYPPQYMMNIEEARTSRRIDATRDDASIPFLGFGEWWESHERNEFVGVSRFDAKRIWLAALQVDGGKL